MNETWPKMDVDPLSSIAWKRIEEGVFTQLDASAERAKTTRMAPSRSKVPWLVGGTGALAAAAVLAFVLLGGGETAQPGTHLSRIVTTSAPTEVTLADAAVTVAPASALSAQFRDGDASIQLERGTVHCRVPKRKRGQEFLVEAGGVRVYVVGTEFAVMRQGDGASVAVMEGTVRVLYRGRYELVDAGESWSSTGDEYVFDALDARSKRRRRARSRKHVAKTDQAIQQEVAEETVEETAPEMSEAQRLYREAASLEGTDPAAAEKLYRQAEAHSGPWAALALYAHGRLELERGNKQAGTQLLRSYLQRFPDGRNADDARELLGQ